MIILTIYLLILLYQQKANFNKRPEWSIKKESCLKLNNILIITPTQPIDN
jgi:hypothetical protein